MRTSTIAQDEKIKSTELMFLSETTKTKNKLKQNRVFETMVFKTQNTRKQKTVILEKWKLTT